MEHILNKLENWYEKHFADKDELPAGLTDPVSHNHKIKTYGADLRNAELPLEERASAALYIGMLTYTGGVSAAALTSEYIEDMIDILIMPDTAGKVRIPVLKGLAGVCYINLRNQNIARECHLTDVLLACLDEDEDALEAEADLILVKFWACYLMTIVCCNISFVKLFHDSGGQMLHTRLESLSSMEWFGWPQNYAEVLLRLLGYQKRNK